MSNSTAQIRTSVNNGSLSPRSDKESIVMCQYLVITYCVDLRGMIAPLAPPHTHWLYVIKFMIHEVFYVRPRDLYSSLSLFFFFLVISNSLIINVATFFGENSSYKVSTAII